MCTLILLIGMGAVSAIQQNSTNECLSFEQNDQIGVIENNTEVLSYGSSEDVVSVGDCGGDVLSSESGEDVVSVGDCGGDVLNIENSDSKIISSSNNDDNVLTANTNQEELLGSWGYSPADEFTQTKSEYKTFYLGQVKFPKKYKKFVKGYKPSKKNKKAWKKYKAYKKISYKQLKKFSKYGSKIYKKANNQHWNFLENTMCYKIKYRGKYMYLKFYCDAYREFHYNPFLRL